MHPHRQLVITPDEVVADALGSANNLDILKAFHNFLPKDTQLHLCKAVTHAAVNTHSKGQMVTHIGSVNNEAVGLGDNIAVPVSRRIPKDDTAAFWNRLAPELYVPGRCTAHVRQRSLISNDLGHH